jgi:capsular polysaccharide transport system permease protein
VSQAAERLRMIGARQHPAESLKKSVAQRGLVHAPALVRSTLDRLAATNSSGGGWWTRSLGALVIAPSLLFFVYAAIWQSKGYEAEARVTVRGAQEFRGSMTDTSSIISRVAGGGVGAKTTIQDAYIVLNYVKSEAIILDLGGAKYLEKYFSPSGIDYFSRLPTGATIEELLKYWFKRVAASVDTVSGIVTIKVEAFQPADASRIAQDIVRLSENLINNITERSRKDAVQRAENEVSRAGDKLAATRDKLTVFRDRSAIIDPAIRAKSVAEVIAKLTLDKVAIESSLATLDRSLRPDSPSQRIQRTKLAAIDQQIAELNKSLTDPNSDSALSAQIATYERLKLDEQFDELMYTISQSSYQRARQELERRQLYLVVVVPPATPEKATYPKVMASSLLLFAALFTFWSIGALIAASIADQMV